MAYYKTLYANGIPKEKVLEYVKNETLKAASIKRDEMKRLENQHRYPELYCVYYKNDAISFSQRYDTYSMGLSVNTDF